MSLDDLTLVVRAQEGDVRAFEVLARRHQAALYRTAVRVTGDPPRPRTPCRRRCWTPGATSTGSAATPTFSTWLYRLVTNRCIAALRRRRPVPAREAGDRRRRADPPNGRPCSTSNWPRWAGRCRISRTTCGCAGCCGSWKGLGYSEIAKITGAGETAVRGRIHRARVQLAGVMRAWQ